MSNLPVNVNVANSPINIGHAVKKVITPERAEDEAITVSILSDAPAQDVDDALKGGDRSIIREAKAAVSDAATTGLSATVDAAFAEDLEPEATASVIANEEEKLRQFYSAGDNLYLDQAVALGDPNVDAELSRASTNLQIGQEIFEKEISETAQDTSWAGYAGDFVDRYLLRAIPIGGLEQISNRNERKGNELMHAALTMRPAEYETFIRAYVEELRDEGFFKSDNIFALLDGMAELDNAGHDANEFFNRTIGILDLTPALSLGKVVRATTPLRRIAALRGPKASADAGEQLLKANTNPNPRVVNDLKPEALDPGRPAPVKVPANRDVRISTENSIVREMTDITSRGGLGKGVDSSVVQRAYTAAVTTLRKAANNPIVNIRHPLGSDATGNITMQLTLGTIKSGSPYRTAKAAAKQAAKLKDDFPTVEVVPVDKADLEKGFYIEINELLDTSKFVDEVSDQSLYNGLTTMLSRFLGQKATTENATLNTMATMAEGVASSMSNGRAVLAVKKVLNKVPTEQQGVISKVFTELRDGKDAFIREHYSDGEFIIKYKSHHPRGEAPTQREIDAFNAARTINDASFMMRAHNRMQNYMRNGYYGLDLPGNVRAAGRVTDEVLGDEAIFDIQQGTVFRKADLHSKTKVWELDRELEGGVRYIVNPSKVRTLSHSDVLGYNAGGRRINPNAAHFVTLGEDTPRAFLTAVTDEQAQIAKTQIENIQEVVRAAGDIPANTRILDDVIRANNDWNPELQSFADFAKFAKEKRLDFTKKVFTKNRDGEIATGETRDFFSTNWDDYVTFNMHRADDTLIEFGGKEAMNYDPVNAMFKDFGSISQQYAHNVYTQTALNSWLKAARRKGSGWKVPDTTDPRRAFDGAEKSELTNKRASELGRQNAIIKRRLGVKSQVFQHMESYGAEASEYVFGKTGKNIGRDPAKGIANGILQIGMQSAFGLMNTSQFFVQGFHALTIAALTQNSFIKAGSGMKGIAMAPAVRLILMGSKTAEQEIVMIERLAKWAGQSVDEMTETIDYIRISGRDILDGSMVESGTGSQWGLSGWKGESYLPSAVKDIQRGLSKAAGGALKAGLMPFREGERASRLTGINAAILEYRQLFPGKSLKTSHANTWISRREQNLSFRMTNANRALIQEGFGKLPTQWFTYTLRAMENVIVGRDFTKGERIRMALVMFPAFGMTGMGGAAAADWLAELVGAEPAGKAHTFIKLGIMDTLIETISGGEIELAVAERLAPFTLLQDIWKGVEGQKSPMEMVAGPSGDILSGVIGSTLNVVGEIINGNSVSMTEDVIRTARQFSGVDNVFKAYGIYQNGIYRSRNGKALPFEMDAGDAVGQLLGFSPREVTDWYQEKEWAYNDSRVVKDLTTNLQTDFDRALEIWEGGDEARSLKLLESIEHKIVLSGLSPFDQRTIRRALKAPAGGVVYRMILDHYRRSNPYRAQVLEETFGGK